MRSIQRVAFFSILYATLVALGISGTILVNNNYPVSVKRITISPGGGVFDFVEDYTNDRNNHVKFIIDGPCISACTFILGEIPPENVCVTPYAMMAFHSAYSMEGKKRDKRVFDPEINTMLWMIYPAWVRDWLRENGWDNPNVDQATLIFMPNEVLLKHYKACKG